MGGGLCFDTEPIGKLLLPSRSLTQPLKSYLPNGKVVLQPPFFSGAMLNFGGVMFLFDQCVKHMCRVVVTWKYLPPVMFEEGNPSQVNGFIGSYNVASPTTAHLKFSRGGVSCGCVSGFSSFFFFRVNVYLNNM